MRHLHPLQQSMSAEQPKASCRPSVQILPICLSQHCLAAVSSDNSMAARILSLGCHRCSDLGLPDAEDGGLFMVD